jgi:2-amino-4-hydroxy-6-hydroxymethyldihydropteridine diphosphokinase
MCERVFVALGSNLGDRQATLQTAVDRMGPAGLEVVGLSPWFQTAPVGGPEGQKPYLNAAAELRTDRTPAEVLDQLQRIEFELGRDRRSEVRWGPRSCDLDILLFGRRIVQTDTLIIPHPRMHQRRFVLEPLARIAPEVVHPVLGKTISELLADLPAGQEPTP